MFTYFKPKKKSSVELYYLAQFTQEELESFTDNDGKSFINDLHKEVHELEETIALYWKTQWYYRIENWLANASNLLFVIFQINTSGEGVDSFVKAFAANVTVPASVSSGIGISTSLLSTGLYALAFSAYREAIISTLRYGYSKPIRTQMTDAFLYAQASPMGALSHTLGFLLNQTTLLSSNLTGTMSEIVDINTKINALPTPLNWIVIVTILFFGNKYYQKFMNADYHKGLQSWIDFMLNKDNHPSILTEIMHGNIATPVQILLQGVSAVGLRTFPLYYYLALASATALGGWIPAPLVAALVTWHSICALYPETYHLYMDDKILVSDLINEKIQPILATQRQANPNMTVDELKSATQHEFDKIKKAYEAEIISEHGRAYVFKEPLTAVSIACRTAIGGYLGWQSTTLIATSSIAAPIVGTAVGACIFGGLLYRAESSRIMYKLIGQRIKQEQNPAETKEIPPTTCESISDAFAKLLNISNGIVMTTSTIGVGARLLPANSPVLAALVVISAEKGANYVQFTGKKVQQTTRDVFVPTSCSSSPHAIFNRSRHSTDEKIELEAILPKAEHTMTLSQKV